MYSIQALWTAAHHKLPITYVVANNGGYRIIKQRLKSFHGSDHFIGMDFVAPKVEFAALAASLGVPSERISDPKEIAPALARGIAGPGPRLLEVMVESRL
jgi:benzoylformate decarboxylase